MHRTARYLDDRILGDLLPSASEAAEPCTAALVALERRACADDPGLSDQPPKVPVAVGRPGAFAHGMPAAVVLDGTRLVGAKWISGDPERPPPRLSGLLLIEDPEVGGVRGILSASAVTGVRTAAVSLAALRAAPPRTEGAASGRPWRVALVAGGTQAVHHRAALEQVAPDATVTFVTRRAPGELPLRPNDAATGPDRLHEAVAEADLVITSVAFGTPGRELDPSRIRPGATVVATDYATAVTARTVAGVREHGADWTGPRLITDDPVQFDATRAKGALPDYPPADATLGALLRDPASDAGRAVRERPVGATVVVNHLGVAVCDLAVGWAALRRAEATGAGVLLPR